MNVNGRLYNHHKMHAVWILWDDQGFTFEMIAKVFDVSVKQAKLLVCAAREYKREYNNF